MPVAGIVYGVTVELFGMLTVAVWEPVTVGEKVSTKVQGAAGRTLIQVFEETVNGPTGETVIVPMVSVAVPVFVQVSVLLALVLVVTLPNVAGDGAHDMAGAGGATPIPVPDIATL